MGDRWLESGPILGALAVAGALQLLAYVGYWVYLSRALTTQLFHFTMVSVALRIACIIVGSFWGAFGIAVGVAVASGLQVPVSIAWLSRVGNVPFWPIMRGAIRAFVMAVLAGVAAWSAVQALVGAGSLAQLAGAGAAALGVYLLGLLIPSVRADVMVLVGLAKVARQRA
jgi:PST family polysaccharide transporter